MPIQPYNLKVFLSQERSFYEEEIVVNENTGEKLSIRKEKSIWAAGGNMSIEIKRRRAEAEDLKTNSKMKTHKT